MVNKITIIKKETKKIKDFEKREWKIANLERYGKNPSLKKNFYKLVSKNEKGDILGIVDLITDSNVAYLDSLLVSSKHRLEGIGKALIAKAEKIAKENKCTKIVLETEENWGAPKFYKKLGYKITGKHPKHYFGTTCLIMTKFI